MAKSKFFRAFVEGSTISDGRKITAEMIDECVETFNAETYAPRINVEHIAGFSPEPPFNGYGTVVAVKAQDDEITIAGKKGTYRALYCQVDGNAQLQKLAKQDQKPFPSVELTDSYASSGKVGLIGLAFTDRPASVATERLQFSRSAPGSQFAAGADAVIFGFDPEAPDNKTLIDSIKSTIAAGFASITAKPEPEKKPDPKPDAAVPFDTAAFAALVGDQIAGAVGTLSAAFDAKLAPLLATQADYAALKTKLEGEPAPDGFSRKPATGGAAISADVY